MKLQKIISVGAALALLPFVGRSAVDVSATVSAPPPVVAPVNTARDLSPQAHEVVKLVSSGVPNDVIKAYIDSSSSTFNLTSDNIVHLQQLGVSGALLTEMLDHDRALRQMAMATPPPQAQTYPPNEQYPAQVQPAPDNSASQADTDYYSQLSPYGNWNYVPDYGYAWQPYSWLAYSAYPWATLGWGYWWNCPGYGWCWFPRYGYGYHGGYYAGYHGYHGYYGGYHGGYYGYHGGFGRGVATPHGAFGGFHGSVGGFHSGIGGFHGSVGGFHGGSMGGFHGGGGFGGGHGGGGGGGHR